MLSRPGKEMLFKDLSSGEFFSFYSDSEGTLEIAIRMATNTHPHKALLIATGTEVWIRDDKKVTGMKHPLDLSLP